MLTSFVRGQGHVPAMNNLGLHYLKGYGCDRKPELAIRSEAAMLVRGIFHIAGV
jgi:hypothetical protein